MKTVIRLNDGKMETSIEGDFNIPDAVIPDVVVYEGIFFERVTHFQYQVVNESEALGRDTFAIVFDAERDVFVFAPLTE